MSELVWISAKMPPKIQGGRNIRSDVCLSDNFEKIYWDYKTKNWRSEGLGMSCESPKFYVFAHDVNNIIKGAELITGRKKKSTEQEKNKCQA